MNLLETLHQALGSIGQGTPASAQGIQREQAANQQLNQQNSVMGSERQGQLLGQQSPLAATISHLVNALNPIDWMGGQGAEGMAAHVPGTYRALGLERSGASGSLNPAQYLAKLQMETNFKRFQELVQMFTRQGLGESFPVARGASQVDPLVQALQAGKQAPVTAVTHGMQPSNITTTLPSGEKLPVGHFPTAERFAQSIAETSRKPSYVMQGIATPADVAAFVPRRGQYSRESELILQPTPSFQGNLVSRYTPPSSQFPWVDRVPLPPAGKATQLTGDVSWADEIIKALQQAAQPPNP